MGGIATGKKADVKPLTKKEMNLDEVIIENLTTKEDNYGNKHVLFKVFSKTQLLML